MINPPQYPIHDMVITNPTVETNKLLKEQIELLHEQNSEVKKQAENSKRDAQKSLIFGWVSFLVATIIGIGSILVAILIKQRGDFNMNRSEKTNVKLCTKKQERPIIAFWHKNRRGILIATGIIGTIGTVILALFGIKYYWNATAFERWFKKASLDELKTVRNNVHSEYMKHTVNDKYRETLWNLLPRLDKKISELEWDGKTPSGPAYHREHGYNLYKPD